MLNDGYRALSTVLDKCPNVLSGDITYATQLFDSMENVSVQLFV
jgi:hypothetical protein